MKKIYGLLMAVVISAAAMAQATPHEKAVVKNDLVRERDKRNDVARDIVRGNPERARADHRAAVYYHKKAHSDIRQVHRNAVVRKRYYPHHYVRHHYRPHRPIRHHRTTTVVIRH